MGVAFVGKDGSAPVAAQHPADLPALLLHVLGRAATLGVPQFELEVPSLNALASRHPRARPVRPRVIARRTSVSVLGGAVAAAEVRIMNRVGSAGTVAGHGRQSRERNARGARSGGSGSDPHGSMIL